MLQASKKSAHRRNRVPLVEEVLVVGEGEEEAAAAVVLHKAMEAGPAASADTRSAVAKEVGGTPKRELENSSNVLKDNVC